MFPFNNTSVPNFWRVLLAVSECPRAVPGGPHGLYLETTPGCTGGGEGPMGCTWNNSEVAVVLRVEDGVGPEGLRNILK
jgi:hypothetical protein